MRTTADRIRHAVSFEIIGLVLVTPVVSVLFHLPAAAVGIMTVIGSVLATIWTYLYNLGFDHGLRWLTGRTDKGWALRLAHAVLYEASLVVVMMPLLMWALDIGWAEALLLDISLAAFYVAYAFGFNLAYDRLFPVPAA